MLSCACQRALERVKLTSAACFNQADKRLPAHTQWPPPPFFCVFVSFLLIFCQYDLYYGCIDKYEQIICAPWCLSCTSILATKRLKEYFNIFHVNVTLLKSTVRLQLCLHICRAYSSVKQCFRKQLFLSSPLQHKPEYVSGKVVTLTL